jgi:hypothetical protein
MAKAAKATAAAGGIAPSQLSGGDRRPSSYFWAGYGIMSGRWSFTAYPDRNQRNG